MTVLLGKMDGQLLQRYNSGAQLEQLQRLFLLSGFIYSTVESGALLQGSMSR